MMSYGIDSSTFQKRQTITSKKKNKAHNICFYVDLDGVGCCCAILFLFLRANCFSL